MTEFRDDQRYSLEEAREESMDLKIMVETECYDSQTYDEALYYLPEFRLDQAIMVGQAARRAAESDGEYYEDPSTPIIDSENAWYNQEPADLGECPDYFHCDLDVEYGSDECKECERRWIR